jgi:hypothetical protein
MSDSSGRQDRVHELQETCHARRTHLLSAVAQSPAANSIHLHAEEMVRAVVATLIDLGGVDLAQKLLLEPMRFDDANEAIRRLSDIEKWCQARLDELKEDEEEVIPVCSELERIEVVDTDTGDCVVFDKTECQVWGDVREERWDSGPLLDDFPHYEDRNRLFRHRDGSWTLLCESFHFLAGSLGPPEARRLTDAEAAAWLLRNSLEVPEDVADLARPLLFKPGPPATPSTAPKRDGSARAKPEWNADRGELTFGGKLCKRFRQPAPNQRLLLTAFHEAGWPARMDDPMPGGGTVDRRDRLRDTVRQLNKKCKQITFELDGTGDAVIWSPRSETGEPDSTIPF